MLLLLRDYADGDDTWGGVFSCDLDDQCSDFLFMLVCSGLRCII